MIWLTVGSSYSLLANLILISLESILPLTDFFRMRPSSEEEVGFDFKVGEEGSGYYDGEAAWVIEGSMFKC